MGNLMYFKFSFYDDIIRFFLYVYVFVCVYVGRCMFIQLNTPNSKLPEKKERN